MLRLPRSKARTKDPFSLPEREIQRNLIPTPPYRSQEVTLFILGIILKGGMKAGKDEGGRERNK